MMGYTLEYLFVLLSDLHIGTGIPGHGLDDLIARSASGVPVVPSTVVKGAARDALVGAGLTGGLDTVFGKEDGDGGILWFSDAECPDAVIGSRSGVALDEGRSAIRGALLEIGVVRPLVFDIDWRPAVFTGRVEVLPGIPTDSGSDGRRALELAANGLARIETLGSRTTRGFGKVAVAILPSVDGGKEN